MLEMRMTNMMKLSKSFLVTNQWIAWRTLKYDIFKTCLSCGLLTGDQEDGEAKNDDDYVNKVWIAHNDQ